MSGETSIWMDRWSRLRSFFPAPVVRGPGLRSTVPLVAVTCSRLGLDPRLHHQVCRFLRRSMLDCRRRHAEILVASGSAVEPWALRAAELFGVTCHAVDTDCNNRSAQLLVVSDQAPSLMVDAAAIALADRIDAAYVRRGGRIAECLLRRLEMDDVGSVRVAVTRSAKCGSGDLIRAGAIGWLELGAESLETGSKNVLGKQQRIDLSGYSEHAWECSQGDWLIHCTRGRVGNWPEETERQYRDTMLLGGPAHARRGPLEALLRIVRSGRILAGAQASRHDAPVVCFSALSVRQLMQQRCYRPHLRRWDYEPYGVAVRTTAAAECGVQPVIYGSPQDRSKLPPSDRFRFHPRGRRWDWTLEQEWRSPRTIDLKSFDPQDVRIFALDRVESRAELRRCPWSVSFLPTITPSTAAD